MKKEKADLSIVSSSALLKELGNRFEGGWVFAGVVDRTSDDDLVKATYQGDPNVAVWLIDRLAAKANADMPGDEEEGDDE